jgi:hypothetical protein
VNIETTLPSGTPPAPMTSAQAATAQTAAKQAICSDKNALAAIYKTTNNVELNSKSLTDLMSCIEKDRIVKALAILNKSGKFTYENNNPLCNLTRGFTLCGKCAHSQNSCHYGGKTGNQGAMAVDYNWNGATITYDIATRTPVSPTDSRCVKTVAGKTEPSGQCRTVTGEEGLFDELYRAMKINKCPYTLLNFEGNHQHISTIDCSADGGKNSITGRRPPQVP